MLRTATQIAAIVTLVLGALVAVNREHCRNRRATLIIPEMKPINKSSPVSSSIRQISLLGERNSGTRWTYDHLSNCFNHSLLVENHLTRYKHWFQSPNTTRYRRERNTLVIAQFRNPYDWLEAMRIHPHHAPKHLNIEWQDFLQTPWTMERIGTDLNITSNTTRCHQDFLYNQIFSCSKEPLPREAYNGSHPFHMSRHQPFYELKQDGSGMPFESILELRAAKIYNFLETKDYPDVGDAWPVQYEALVAKGTKDMLDKISEITGVPYTCDPFPVQNRATRELPDDFVKYVTEHVDWTAEKLIGYHPRQSTKEKEPVKVNSSFPQTFFLEKQVYNWES